MCIFAEIGLVWGWGLMGLDAAAKRICPFDPGPRSTAAAHQ